MPLSAEQQALFDHARNSLPRWLTRGKTAMLEWLHAYTQMFDSARAQGQDWVDITYLDNAVGPELDQHALDRGTIRRDGESDVTLRERLRNITDVVTEPALKAGVNALLAASALGPSAWVELRRDRAHFQMPRGNYPTSGSQLTTALGGYGNFSSGAAGYLFDETSGNLAAVFGSPSLTPVSSPLYGLAGPYGVDIDKAIGFDSTADAFSGGDVFNVNATADLFLIWIGYVTAAPPAARDWIGKRSGAGWYMFRSNSGGGAVGFWSDDGVDSLSAIAVPPLNEWHIGAAVIDQSTNRQRLCFKGITTGTVTISAETDITALGDATNGANMTVGAGNWASADTDLKLAGMYIVTGTNVATGLSANLQTAVDNFSKYLFPKKSTAFMSRGYRMTNATTPMGYIVILPYGTTVAMAEAVEEYLRQYGPAGYYFKVERRQSPP